MWNSIISMSRRSLIIIKNFASGEKEVLYGLVNDFNIETNDGRDMQKFSDLLEISIENILVKKKKLESLVFLIKGGTSLFKINLLD